jgi:hypothetical protein
LTQLVVIEHGEGARVAVPLEEIEVISTAESVEEEQDSAADNESQADVKNQKQ